MSEESACAELHATTGQLLHIDASTDGGGHGVGGAGWKFALIATPGAACPIR